ncbi:MAG: putative response regulator receiver protein [Phycisphaerales bacterium]|nr:putative response regulator receiver protein [Phycisphaerales bacterium]
MSGTNPPALRSQNDNLFLHPSTVLIVDDNVQNIELLTAFLQALPVNVVTARDGVEALERIARLRADLILLDVMMPRMSGLQVCRRLKADPATRGIPILIVTALNETGDIEAARDAGCDDFVSKPVSRFELLARVKWLLGSRGG